MHGKHSYLSDLQQVSYWTIGYLFPIDVFTPFEANRLRCELEDWERKWISKDLPLPLNTYKRVNSHVVCKLAYKLSSHDTILDKVESILGVYSKIRISRNVVAFGIWKSRPQVILLYK